MIKKIYLIYILPFIALILTTPKIASAAGEFKSYFCSKSFGVLGTCSGYGEWIRGVWTFSLLLAVPLSTLVLVIAGVLWVTSGGDPNKLKTARKLIIGVVSGAAVLILGRIFLVTLLGPNVWNA